MENKSLKKLLYWVPNFILLMFTIIYVPLQEQYLKVLRTKSETSPENIVSHGSSQGVFWISYIIICALVFIALRIIFNGKRCNITSKAIKIINTILTIFLLGIMILLRLFTALA